MRCTTVLLWLQANGPAAADEAVRLHLVGCPACRRRAESMAAAADLMRDPASHSVPSPPRPDALAARLAARLDRTTPRRAPILAWAIPAAAGLAAIAWLAVTLVRDAPGPATDGTGAEVASTPGGLEIGGRPDRAPGQDAVPSRAIGRQPRTGDVVEAGPWEVVLDDPGVGTLVLAPGTHVWIEAWGARTTVVLESGRVEATVRPRGPAEGFEVRTDLAAARVVGTRFLVDHRPGERTEVRVSEGQVSVASPSGVEVARLTAGGVARLGPDGPWCGAAIGTTAPRIPCDRRSGSDAGATPGEAIAAGTHRQRAAPPPREPPAPAPDVVPATIADLMARIREQATTGHDRTALESLSGALAAHPEHRPRLLALLGDLHRAAGRRDEARAAWDEAIDTWAGAAPEGVYGDDARVLEELGRPVEAARAWSECLERYPQGRLAGLALERIAAIEEAAGRADRAMAVRTRLVDEVPGSPEAVPILAAVGMALRAAGDLEGAASWFQGRTGSGHPDMAEAALVGLMRVRLEQGRAGDVRTLAAAHAARFPEGRRADEVARVVEALGPGR